MGLVVEGAQAAAVEPTDECRDGVADLPADLARRPTQAGARGDRQQRLRPHLAPNRLAEGNTDSN